MSLPALENTDETGDPRYTAGACAGPAGVTVGHLRVRLLGRLPHATFGPV